REGARLRRGFVDRREPLLLELLERAAEQAHVIESTGRRRYVRAHRAGIRARDGSVQTDRPTDLQLATHELMHSRQSMLRDQVLYERAPLHVEHVAARQTRLP